MGLKRRGYKLGDRSAVRMWLRAAIILTVVWVSPAQAQEGDEGSHSNAESMAQSMSASTENSMGDMGSKSDSAKASASASTEDSTDKSTGSNHPSAKEAEEMKPRASDTHHIEVKPEDAEGNRLPYMTVTLTMSNLETNEKSSMDLHPMLTGKLHYGANVFLKPAKYKLHFRLEPPAAVRGHGAEKKWLEAVEAEFDFDAAADFNKVLQIGKKEAEDMKVTFLAEHPESMFALEGTEQEHSSAGHQAHESEADPSGVSQSGETSSGSSPVALGLAALIGLLLGLVIPRLTSLGKK